MGGKGEKCVKRLSKRIIIRNNHLVSYRLRCLTRGKRGSPIEFFLFFHSFFFLSFFSFLFFFIPFVFAGSPLVVTARVHQESPDWLVANSQGPSLAIPVEAVFRGEEYIGYTSYLITYYLVVLRTIYSCYVVS